MNVIALLLCGALPQIVSEAPAGAQKLPPPGTRRDTSQAASATRAPWVDSNGWRLRRNPEKTFFYDNVPGPRLALAAAEAFAYNGKVAIRADAASPDLRPMLDFLRGLEDVKLPPVADILLIDDGSAGLGEIMNLLSRRNLLFTTNADNRGQVKLVVEPGKAPYPSSSNANPAEFANLVRKNLTDAKRSIRLYASDTVVAYLLSDGKRARLHLINYATDPMEMFRVRTLGNWNVERYRCFGQPGAALEEIAHDGTGTEFSVPVLPVYAVIDLIAGTKDKR